MINIQDRLEILEMELSEKEITLDQYHEELRNLRAEIEVETQDHIDSINEERWMRY